MANNLKIGQLGEDLASQYLLNNKYKIITRNYRETWGEIDIIAQDPNKTLVFVEVKTLKTNANIKPVSENIDSLILQDNNLDGLRPEDNLSQSKLEKVKRTANIYANAHSNLINEKMGWRIDLIAIEIPISDLKNIQLKDLLNLSKINHYKGIVD